MQREEAYDRQAGVAVTEELECSPIEAELTELVDKAAQVILLRGDLRLRLAGKDQI